jgi:hypothetical protein
LYPHLARFSVLETIFTRVAPAVRDPCQECGIFKTSLFLKRPVLKKDAEMSPDLTSGELRLENDLVLSWVGLAKY